MNIFGKLSTGIKTKIEEYKRDHSLQGSWKLFEYYTEYNCDLTNFKEPQITAEKITWDLEFIDGGKYKQHTSLKIPIIEALGAGTWSRERNYVTIIHPADFRQNVEFQFAFEKGNLKLLKKDVMGKIIVFAFFKRVS
jgi:hypothetical protein